MVNCAHPEHVLPAVGDAGDWVSRVHGLRVNASAMSHAELDESETLDEGDLDVLVPAHRRLERALPSLGCRGRLLRYRRAPRRRTVGRVTQRSGTNR